MEPPSAISERPPSDIYCQKDDMEKLKRCFACNAPAYYKTRPAPEIGMGLWCSTCHKQCGHCPCDEQEVMK